MSEAITRTDLANILREVLPTPAHGMPGGGTTGQVLTKNSGADYDVEWTTPSSIDTAIKKTWVQTTSTSLAAQTGAWKYATTSIPSGYTPLCVVQAGVNHGWVNITGTSVSVSGSTATAGFFCQNITTGSITCQADGYIVFIKSTLL